MLPYTADLADGGISYTSIPVGCIQPLMELLFTAREGCDAVAPLSDAIAPLPANGP